MRELIGHIKDSTHLRFHRIHRFKPKLGLYIEFGPYVLKTAETQDELRAGFRLRHEVFHGEFRGVRRPGLDIDAFDKDFDHLIIIEKETKAVIGTYRLSGSVRRETSYTGLEFDLTDVFMLPGPFLELGRACIRKDFRKGAVISLLWRGIAEYMNLSGAQVLLGCSSLKITDAADAALVYQHLRDEGAALPVGLASPTRKFRMPGLFAHLDHLQNGLSDHQRARAEALIPPLLKSYLKFGARIAAAPAYDADFHCIDLLTLLRREDLPESVVKRFGVGAG